MIKFNNLEKACEELNFKISRIDTHLIVLAGFYKDILYVHKEKIWDFGFHFVFNWLKPGEKAKLIKAITRDYEEYLNGD